MHGRRERLGQLATFNATTGAAGYVSPKEGDYARAEALGVRVVLMLVETFKIGSGLHWSRSCSRGWRGAPTS